MIQDIINNIQSESKSDSNPLMIVHYNHNEAIWSDIIQKTPHGHFDKDTGLRSYEPFGELLKDPEFASKLEKIFELTQAKGGEPEAIGDELENKGVELSANYKFSPAPGDSMPEVQELSMHGKKGDDLIVLMPKNMVEFLAHQKGTLSINPKTGFPQFFFKKLLPTILGAVGAGLAAASSLATGPLSAALLGALGGAGGSFAGSHLAGAGGRHAGKAALFGGLGGALTGGLGNYLGAKNFNVAGGLTDSGAKELATQQIAQQGTQAATEGAAKTAADAASKGFDWGNLGKIMAVSSIIPQFMGAQQEKKAIKAEKLRQEREEEKRRQELMQMNQHYMGQGLDPAVYNNTPLRRSNPDLDWDNPDFYKGGRSHHWFSKYNTGGQVKSPVRYLKEKKGGVIDGHEKGQEDNVYTTNRSGDFIIDASVTSDVGDGNTKAGTRIWKKFMEPYLKGAPDIKTPPVKTALSAGEMIFPVKGVARIGGGSIEKGGHILQEMVKRIRAHKASNGTELPPAALPLHQYLRGLS